jgi:seryl-tRNA synthetase
MNDIDGVDGNYNNSLKAQLEKKMADNLSEIKVIKTELDEKVKEFNQALPTVESSATKIGKAETEILLLKSSVAGLVTSVAEL